MDHLAALAAAQHAFAAGLRAADPEAPVAACAPWTVADLALHLGTVHWWAAAMATGVDLDLSQPTAPRGTDAVVRFYEWAADHLRGTLAAQDPDAPALTLNGPGRSAFWRRRQLHETLVHLWDLTDATGTDPDQLPSAVWADTVAEVVDTMTPRQVRLGRIAPLVEAVDLVAPEAGWTLGAGRAEVQVSGEPRDLALLLWHRLAPGERSLRVTGDAAVLDRLLALRLTP